MKNIPAKIYELKSNANVHYLDRSLNQSSLITFLHSTYMKTSLLNTIVAVMALTVEFNFTASKIS